jgi:lysozyme
MATAARRGASAAAVVLAITLIHHWEGEDLVAKHNSFDPKGVITVCNGITNYDLPWLKAGVKFTHAQCQEELTKALPKYIDPIVACVPSLPDMPPHRQASLISFSYNLGPKRICNSQIGKELNAGNVKTACALMVNYIRADGKVLPGLVNRRTDSIWGEKPWCLRED